jgi:phosphatidylserine decarboxylase
MWRPTNRNTVASEQTPPFCIGPWLASDQSAFAQWMADLVTGAASCERPLAALLQAFADAVDNDRALRVLVDEMFAQVPTYPPYDCSPTGEAQIRSFRQMLQVFNVLLTRPPFFNTTGLTGLPINAVVDWSMATPSGHAVFLNATFNRHLKQVLDQWGAFLRSPASLPALSEDAQTGWFGPVAMQHMPAFDAEFECDPGAPYRGYTSWDDFFTRAFRPGRRPVASPRDDAVIVNACESAPYRLVHDVQLEDRFWIKAQPYSLRHMLADDGFAPRFAGGTVYQAFLSAFSYHRWHSPVSGTIIRTSLIEGTYYAQCQAEGFDPSSPRTSQAYITQVAARAVIYIEADHPAIGLMCFIAVGMAEVSSCEIGVKAGQRVQKGDEIGMFHFGGSTHCLLFRPGTLLDFDLRGQTPGLDAGKIDVNSVIATLKTPSAPLGGADGTRHDA